MNLLSICRVESSIMGEIMTSWAPFPQWLAKVQQLQSKANHVAVINKVPGSAEQTQKRFTLNIIVIIGY